MLSRPWTTLHMATCELRIYRYKCYQRTCTHVPHSMMCLVSLVLLSYGTSTLYFRTTDTGRWSMRTSLCLLATPQLPCYLSPISLKLWTTLKRSGYTINHYRLHPLVDLNPTRVLVTLIHPLIMVSGDCGHSLVWRLSALLALSCSSCEAFAVEDRCTRGEHEHHQTWMGFSRLG